ncbi:hypothetical protein FK513_29260, partial [Klebsiella pneumoniae]|uniref:hypothetical protein n=1 Tax=Klebsiella pneumoniae TaxID=573 RepID=UPI00210D9546
FVLVPMVNATLAYFALKLDLVSRVVSMTPWTTPAPIDNFSDGHARVQRIVALRVEIPIRFADVALPAYIISLCHYRFAVLYSFVSPPCYLSGGPL